MPQLHYRREMRCLVEVHQDDMHGAAPGQEGRVFVEDLAKDIALKWSGLLGDGADCEILKRRIARTDDATPRSREQNVREESP